MGRVWEVAQGCFDRRGWHRASKKFEKILNKFEYWDDLGKQFKGCYMCVETDQRSGEFSEMLECAKNRIKKKAAGRRIVWLNDVNCEWTEVHLFFGSDEELEKLASCVLLKM